MKQEHVFPKWFYHKDLLEGKIIYSQEQFDSLGKGWVESPADLNLKHEVKLEKAQPAAEVQEKAEERKEEKPEGQAEIQVLKKHRKGDK